MSTGRPKPIRRVWVVLLFALVMLAALLLVATGCKPAVSTRSLPLTVAAYPEPEQQMLAALTITLLRDNGYSVVAKTDLQSAWHVRQALEAGGVSIAWQDSGTVWSEYLGHDRPESSDTALFRDVTAEDYAHGVVWLTALPWSTRQSIVVRANKAQEFGLSSIADLARHVSSVAPDMIICLPDTMVRDARGIAGLQRVYGFSFRSASVREMAPKEALAAVVDGTCDCTVGAVKDLALFEDELVILRDSSEFFAASTLSPTVYVTAINQYPELERILGGLTGALDYATLARLEREVVMGSQSYERMAERFLKAEGLIN
jgi:osmoprotectant transport system substrate-binding protein